MKKLIAKISGDEKMKKRSLVSYDVMPSRKEERFRKAKVAFTLAEGATHVGKSGSKRKSAFTLAEVLITLGIIGVVAAVTIPTLLTNFQAKVKQNKIESIQAKLKQSIQLMSAAGEIGPYYSSSEDFARALSKHLKISTICNSDNIRDCFSADTIKQKDGSTLTVSNLKTFNQLGGGLVSLTSGSDTSSRNVGLILADGTQIILNWNLNCPTVDPESRNEAPFACITAIYDINGPKGPNTRGKDILGINTFSKAKIPTPLTYDECMAVKDKLGIKECCPKSSCNNQDYWAGAVKECGGRQNLPNWTQLMSLAQYLYDDYTGVKDNNLKTSRIPNSLTGIPNQWSSLWTLHEKGDKATRIGFYTRNISPGDLTRSHSNTRFFCIGE